MIPVPKRRRIRLVAEFTVNRPTAPRLAGTEAWSAHAVSQESCQIEVLSHHPVFGSRRS
jgi:hypothetical protein